MNDKGKIYTYSIVRSATEAFQDKVPYVIAVVETSVGRHLARIEGYQEKTPVEIGMEVAFSRVDEGGNPVYSFWE